MSAFPLKKNKIDLSVIVTLYNTKNYLLPCLDSILAGIGTLNAEVILIDDGSDDGSDIAAKEYCSDHPAFRYFRIPESGVSAARNHGVSLARGKYLQFTDSDDLIAPGILQEMFDAAERNHCDLTICDAARITDGKASSSAIHLRAFHGLSSTLTHVREHPALVYDTTVWNKLYLRSWYLKHCFSLPEGRLYGDIATVLPIHYLANRVAVVHRTGYLWRIRTDSNRSITQQYTNPKNLTDKITSLTELAGYIEKNIPEKEIRDRMIEKALRLDFAVFLEGLPELQPEEQEKTVRCISKFYHSVLLKGGIPESVRISVLTRQMTMDVLSCDLEHLLRVLTYKKMNYDRAPIIRTEKGYELVLHPELFPIPERDASDEFWDTPPRCMIDRLSISEKNTDRSADHSPASCMCLSGHLYVRRLDLPDPSGQEISAFLVNEKTGCTLPLPVKPEKTPFLTKEQGTMLNLDDYRYYHYNYDGAGFMITIDPGSLPLTAEFYGRNAVFVEYRSGIIRGKRILRGIKSSLHEQLLKAALHTDQFSLHFELDQRDTLFVICGQEI